MIIPAKSELIRTEYRRVLRIKDGIRSFTEKYKKNLCQIICSYRTSYRIVILELNTFVKT